MRGFYINLDYRTDRRAEVERELEGFGMERFSAIRHSDGLAGCAMSHVACLKLARERGYPEVLIFEDDFMWLGSRDIPDFPEDADVCCLAYNTRDLVPYNDHWSRATNIQTTSGYMARASMQDALIQCWEESIPKLLQTGRHWDYALDQYWKPLQQTSKFQCATPRLGKQRPSQSDLGKKFSDQNGV